jgi:glycosyltransferase involved in cell wall biosynthesis
MGIQTPLVSIVLATYNGARFLEQQLNSLLAQDFRNFEIIAVDDCSTDSTVALLKEYAGRFSHMKVWTNDKNLGYVKNFEKAISLASGSYIATCDQDDIWQPDKISQLMQAIDNYDLVYHDAELIDVDNQSLNLRISDIRNMVDISDPRYLAAGTWIPGNSILFRADLVKKILPFPGNLPHDYWIIFNASAGKGVRYVDRPLVFYRQHSANTIGAIGFKSIRNGKKTDRLHQMAKARMRMTLLSKRHPVTEASSREVYQTLAATYRNYDLASNWRRMCCYIQNRKYFLAYKKKSELMQWLYCFKMFFKIV